MLKYHIRTIELASNAALIDFDSIPQIYDDLEVQISIRLTVTDQNFRIRFNRNSSGVYNERIISGNGSSAASFTRSNADAYNFIYSNVSSQTANTFSSHKLLVPNYTSSTSAKPTSLEGVSENNATAATQYLHAGLFNSTSPITSLQIFYNLGSGEVAQFSSASLYGIKRGADGRTEVASGGTITTSGGYTIHTFTGSGTFTANRDMDVEYLVVAGGGGGAALFGGGGAGGYRCSVQGESSGGGAPAEPKLRVSSGQSFIVQVGSGGAGAGPTTNSETIGTSGNASFFGSISAIGGGGGGGQNANTAQSGGSGGGGSTWAASNRPGGAGTANQGYNGGTGATTDSGGGGGGGAAAVGANGTSSGGGAGGNGIPSLITGSAITRAGGGGGGTYTGVFTSATGGPGGSGGGGNGGLNSGTAGAGNGSAATANTGGGGGGGTRNNQSVSGGNGGSGIVIIRYPTPA